jgi:hypothetical protein
VAKLASMNQFLMPADPPPGHRMRMALRSPLTLLLAAVLVAALAAALALLV